MFKLFTQKQATELLPVVAPLLRDLQDALSELRRLSSEQAKLKPYSIEARNITFEMEFIVRSAKVTKEQLDALGVVVTDVETGMVDFPSTLGAQMVYLSWAQGEDAVTHYHDVTEEADKRQRLPHLSAPPPQLRI